MYLLSPFVTAWFECSYHIASCDEAWLTAEMACWSKCERATVAQFARELVYGTLEKTIAGMSRCPIFAFCDSRESHGGEKWIIFRISRFAATYFFSLTQTQVNFRNSHFAQWIFWAITHERVIVEQKRLNFCHPLPNPTPSLNSLMDVSERLFFSFHLREMRNAKMEKNIDRVFN